MKKLLSICFLSILLGLLSFSTQAQSNCYGFWMENLQPDVLDHVANPGNETGTYALNHTLGHAVLIGQSNRYVGNVGPSAIGQPELYELHFCDNASGKKLSFDWQLERRDDNGSWQIVNDNLSAYADFGIYTLYPQLNQAGQCQSIKWLGGIVPNGIGYCDNSQVYSLLDTILGIPPCTTPTNYPGAVQTQAGTLPGSVLNTLGQAIPSIGMTPIYTEGFDYFYADFLASTRTIVVINWKQVGDYRLVMRVRERVGGTDWTNATWNKYGEGNVMNETAYIGGHMSCCGPVLLVDTLHYPVLDTLTMEVCQGTTTEMGSPYTYTFGVDQRCILDTTVLIGEIVNEDCPSESPCQYIDIDTLRNVNYLVRMAPVAQVEKHTDTLCKCDAFTTDMVRAMVEFDSTEIATFVTGNETVEYKLQWFHWIQQGDPGDQGYNWFESIYPRSVTVNDNNDTTYMYIVRQVNTYNNYGEEVVCAGPADTIYITFREIVKPVVPADTAFCLETIEAGSTLTINATHDPVCANSTRWYTSRKYNYWTYKYDYSGYLGDVDALDINLNDYTPSVNKDTTVRFYAFSIDTTNGCMSSQVSVYTIVFHQTPVLDTVTAPNLYNCPGVDVPMEVIVDNNPLNTPSPYTFMWTGVSSVDLVHSADAPATTLLTEEVSNNNKQTNGRMPFVASNEYNYSQQIFTSTEVPAGKITKLAFNYVSTTDLTKKTDVQIYMTTTSKSEFASNKDFVTNNLELVYSGDLNATTGWKEIELDNPYLYNGDSNLVLVVRDNSGKWQSVYYACSKTTDNKSILITNGSGIPADPTTYSLGGVCYKYRSDVKFTVAPAGYVTTDKFQEAYYHISDTDTCHTAYTSSVYVIDANNCKSTPIVFNYFLNDTVAPVITPATVSYGINACEITSQNVPAYDDLAELVDAFNLDIYDSCGAEFVVLVGHNDVMTIDSCQQTLVRTYTFADRCGNPATFIQTVVSRDSVAPYYTFDRPIRLDPIPAGDCKFNAPSRQVMIDAIAPYVADNCTDSAFLMDGITFVWENTDKDPASDTNIFRLMNHLTITATITDKCDNSFSEVVFFLDRPDDLEIVGHPVSHTGDLCEQQTATLFFDMNSIVDDQEVGPFPPYTLTWYEVNGKDVTFSDIHNDTTVVTFNEGAGDYTFAMRVVNGNDCEAVSAPATINVRELPSLSIIPIVQQPGVVEPYCPTYGNLTIEAVVANAETSGATGYTYTWSGESVNIYSTTETTWITIIPEWCDTTYTATVVVSDERGCTAETSRTFEAAAHDMIFNGIIPDSTVVINQGCELHVPNYMDQIAAENITDDCYTFSQITQKAGWYKQTPAAGTVFSTDSVEVTITITNPCGQTVSTTTYARKPANYPSVKIVPDTIAVCYNEFFEGVTYNTVSENLDDNTTWRWTIGNGIVGTQDFVTLPNDVFNAPVNKDTTYVVNVQAVNSLGCPATATANLVIYYQGDSVQLRVWNNNLCGEDYYNGVIAVDFVPTNYVVTLSQGNVDLEVKISDNNQHEPTLWNTVIFDSLAPGYYTVTVENLNGCTMSADTVVRTDDVIISEPTVTVTDVTVCTDNNGIISVVRENNYGFTLFNSDYSVEYTGIVAGANINFSGLSAGEYKLVKTHIPTGCEFAWTYNVLDASEPETHFDINYTNNTHCVEPNGTIHFTVTGSDPLTLHVWNANYDYTTGAITTDTTITGLGSNLGYIIYLCEVQNTVTQCKSAVQRVMIENKAVHPSFTATPTNNTICPNNTAYNNNVDNLVNGKITIAPANAYTYTVMDAITLDTVKTSLDSLAEGSYVVIAVNEQNGCAAMEVANIGHTYYQPVVETISQTPNSVCDTTYAHQYDGSLTIKVKSSTNTIADFNKYIRPYMIVLDNDTVVAQSTIQQNTITHLEDGVHNYYILTDNKCFVTGSYAVQKYVIDTMRLATTPDHFCAPTFEKPGDGTIVVLSPRNSAAHGYKYKFYDADSTDMTVPYEMPMTYTKYWLADGLYTVFAIDTITGCTFTQNIYVEKELYTITIAADATPSTYCSQTSGDGTITVNATSTNPDAVFNYSLDNQNWQVSNLFSNLANKTYTVYVKDVTTRCVDSIYVGISYSDCRPEITIVDQNGDTAPFEYCINDENVKLCANAFYPLGSECEGTFTYHWDAPCSDPQYSDDKCIDVFIDHVMPNGCNYILTVTNQLTGCSYDTMVYVYVNPKPVIGFNVNGTTYYNAEQSIPFCEQEDLHISVVSMNGQTLVDTLTFWTLGHSGTGLSFDTTGAGYAQDYITICAYSTSTKGCVSNIASLPLNFNRVERITVDTTVCGSFQVPDDIITITSNTYPYYDTVSHTYPGTHPYCDRIVTYNVKLISAPVITPASESVAAFCEDMNYTLANFVDSFAVDTNGAVTSTKWQAALRPSYNYVDVEATTVVDYAFATTHRVRYVATNCCGTDYSDIYFNVSKAPRIDSFQLQSKYCRAQQATLTFDFTVYNPAIAVLTLGADTVRSYYMNSNGSTSRTFTFTPNHANYDGKTLTLSIRNLNNLCDVVTASQVFHVDTTFINNFTIDTIYCAGNTLHYSDLIDGTGYTNVRLWRYRPVYSDYQINNNSEVTYNMNGYLVYFTMNDACGNQITTNRDTIFVRPQPSVTLNGNKYYNVCEDEFALPTPVVPTAVQQFVLDEGWQMYNATTEQYEDATVAQITTAAANNVVTVRYFVETSCNVAYAGPIYAYYKFAPEIAQVQAFSICPTKTIAQAVTVPDITWNNNVNMPGAYRITSYRFVSEDGTSVVTVTPDAVFGQYIDEYNDGSLRIVVTNECGADSTEVAFHIPVETATGFTTVDTCKGMTLADFIVDQPTWTGDEGIVANQTWLIGNSDNVANMSITVATTPINENKFIAYRWTTNCGTVITTEAVEIHPLLTPTVTITVPGHAIVNDAVSICEGNTLSPVANYDYAQYHSTVTNTEWFFNGNAFAPTYQFTANDDNKKLVVKVTTTCEEAYDTIVVRVHPTPDPSIDGPLTACSGEEITVTAEAGFESYIFTINGQASQSQPSNVFETTVFDNNPDGVDITTITVTVTDEFGCTGTSSDKVEVSVTDQAAFVFFNANGSENETHQYSVNDGNGLNYGWMISTECADYDTLVYVEYDIYYEGQLISNDAIGEYFHTGNYTNEWGQIKPFISSNTFSWLSGNSTPLTNTTYYNFAVANPNVATNGNHFPNTNLGLGNTNVYDDLWLRFIGDRAVDATLVPFRLDGEYKIVYRLYSTSHADDFEHYYTEDNPAHDNIGTQSHLGGQNALVNGAIRKLLAIDSITINVENAVAGPSETTAPVLAPAISSEENVIVPEMEVWPNPAPSIVTTFKARVYNMSGEATVTITNFTGKQVYSGNINIDSDNFYFEADVNSLAVGAYIMTVRTDDAVVTKKLVVTVRQ